MKDFFENFGKRFGETAEMVTNKAGEMIEIQRVKSQIRDLARENAVDMMELGKAVYERYKSGEELDDSTAQICDSIKEREKEILEYIKNSCTERVEERQVSEYNGQMFVDTLKGVKVGGATVFTADVDKILKF